MGRGRGGGVEEEGGGVLRSRSVSASIAQPIHGFRLVLIVWGEKRELLSQLNVWFL